MTQERLLKLTEVENLVGFKKTWIYSEVNKGRFPAPIAVARSSRWRLSEVNAWIDSWNQQAQG